MDPSYLLMNVAITVVPFACYYFGIAVRKVVLPGRHSAPWSHQLLLGVPLSMTVVGPLMPVLGKSIGDLSALLVTLGIIIEHGMVLNEAAAGMLRDRMREARGGKPPAVDAERVRPA